MLKDPPEKQIKTTDHIVIPESLPNAPPESFKSLVENQIKIMCNPDKDPRHRRWNKDIISLCLSLYCRSPKAYSDLKASKMLVLPSERLLRFYKNCLDQTPGSSMDMFMWMRKEADRQQVSKAGRHGGLIIDEMAVQDDIQIVKKGDTWHLIGERDMGPVLNNIEVIMAQKREVKMATHALQCLFAGVGGFRWPVAFFASTTATAHQLLWIIWDLVDKLGEQGFIVDYIMWDGASTNRCCTKAMCPNPRDNNFTVQNIFNEDHQISIVQDAKHVLKKIRNNVESSKESHRKDKGRFLLWNGHEILWEHWEEAYKFNFINGVSIHHKLTKEHVDLTPSNKMRNHLALEVLDRNMLYLMLAYAKANKVSEKLTGTLKFLENTSTLVEIFCDTHRPIIDAGDDRLQQLSQVLAYFNDWESQVTADTSLDSSKHLITKETREDINSCIIGFREVCKRWLSSNITVRPGYFNSDVIENFFCQQRGLCNGMNTNPTVSQYGPGVNAIVLGQTTVSRKANAGTKAQPFNATTPKPLNPQDRKALPKFLRL